MDKAIDVDFVILWVDGEDPAWLKDFNQWTQKEKGDKRKSRYRDWDNLRYWFRSIEKNTPWVRKIHFVTYGHLPAWLNTDHEKLNIVNHDQIIEKKYLPVFNCNPIEISIHKIDGLSDHFVYFNDDMFVLKPLNKENFFKKGVPRDIASFTTIARDMIAHIKINDIKIINKWFSKYEYVVKNFFKLFNFRYGIVLCLKSLLLIPWPYFTGFYDPHQPQPFLKETFFDIWNNESESVVETLKARVRSSSDINQYLFRYWQICKGNFFPISTNKTKSISISSPASLVYITKMIDTCNLEMICINDGVMEDKLFIPCRDGLNKIFKKMFPKQSSFEC